MANEVTGFNEFVRRVRKLKLKSMKDLSATQVDAVLSGAWEECAWIQTLTDELIASAIYARMPLEFR
jgi:hypothetical protein